MSRSTLDSTRPLTIAVFALGGQGGGVLMQWIVSLAEQAGWFVQATSVPGVAQRTGATVYYIEMVGPRRSGPNGSAAAIRPVLALMPSPGDVDVVLSAELMEAGRALQRGFVTPDRTTLITSSHRAYAISERAAAGDGIADADTVLEVARRASQRLIAFDMQAIADDAGSVISAALFGALAGSGAAPFPREAFEATISAGGIGVPASLAAFAKAFETTAARTSHTRASHRVPSPVVGEVDSRASALRVPSTPSPSPQGGGGQVEQGGRGAHAKIYPALTPSGHAGVDALIERARNDLPAEAHGIVAAGLSRTIDFQDVAYGAEYLELVEGFLRLDEGHGGAAKGFALTCEAAKHVAVAMAYDDVIRVADLKTRASRLARVRREMAAGPDQIVATTEFMHPRLQEVCGLLPVRLGLAIEGSPRLSALIGRLFVRGQRVRTGTLRWFIPLYAIAGLRRWRRSTLRHAREREHMGRWLERARSAAARDYDLAVEILRCRRLVKGYSDTHARGLSKFDRVAAQALRLEGRPDAAQWVRRLAAAALVDEPGKALDEAIATIDTFM